MANNLKLITTETLTSMEVAEMTGKEHGHLMRDELRNISSLDNMSLFRY